MLTKTYPLAPDQAAAIAAKIKAATNGAIDIDPSRPDGLAVEHGITINWHIFDGKITVMASSNPLGIVGRDLDSLFS